MSAEYRCPRCGFPREGHTAQSRVDAEQRVCSICGVDEALLARDGKPLPQVSEWPVPHTPAQRLSARIVAAAREVESEARSERARAAVYMRKARGRNRHGGGYDE